MGVRPAPLPPPRPGRSPAPAPQPPVADSACQPAGEWRLFTIESNAGQPLRTWYSLKPRAAAGPTDPSIPTIRIYTEGLQRLGYCAASSATVPPVILSTAAWQIVAGRVANAIPLIRAVEPDLDDPNAGALYSPPTSGSISPHTWPVGRYVFVVRLNGYPGG